MVNQCSASTSASVWRFRRRQLRVPFRRDETCVQVLAVGSFLVILKAPSRKSLSGLFSFTLICSCKGVPASGSPRSLSLPFYESLASFLCRSFVALRFFFLICCKFLIKKFRFNAAIDCTFCRHHHNNLLTHLALSALATLHLFRLNFSYLREV